jgi:hypothetical protein
MQFSRVDRVFEDPPSPVEEQRWVIEVSTHPTLAPITGFGRTVTEGSGVRLSASGLLRSAAALLVFRSRYRE